MKKFKKRNKLILVLLSVTMCCFCGYIATHTTFAENNITKNYAQIETEELDLQTYRTTISAESPQITVLTHGLNGNPSHWSHDGSFAFTYTPDSIIEQLRAHVSKGDETKEITLIVAKTAFNDPVVEPILEQSVSKQACDINDVLSLDAVAQAGAASLRAQYYSIDEGQRFITLNKYSLVKDPNGNILGYDGNGLSEGQLTETDILNHIILVFDEFDGKTTSNDAVYKQFEYTLDAISYQYKQLTGDLPTYNLIGHSRGGITNMQYALAHPYNVASLYSMGTPYNGTILGETLGEFAFNLAGINEKITYYDENKNVVCEDYKPGVLDIHEEDLYNSYKNFWNANYNSCYSHIDFTPIGSYLDTGFVFQCLVEYLTMSTGNQFIVNTARVLASGLDTLLTINLNIPNINELKRSTLVKYNLLGELFEKAFGENKVNDLLTYFRTIPELVVHLDMGIVPYLCLSDDLFVDFDSQVATGYNGANKRARLFHALDQINGKKTINNVSIGHNLETFDSKIVSYIVNNIDVGAPGEKYCVRYDGDSCYITGLNYHSSFELAIPETINGYKVIGVEGISTGLTPIEINCRDASAVNGDTNASVYGYETPDFLGNVTTVIIPKDVEIIEDGAFSWCTGLQTVSLESGSKLTKIGANAFSECSLLCNVELPSSLLSIGNCAFANCTSLTKFMIPASVEAISSSAFFGCNSLEKFEVNSANPYFYSRGNDLYIGTNDVNSNTLLRYAPAQSLTSFTIPKDVERIAEYAFEGASNLTHVNLNIVKSISSNAFMGCENLADISGGEQITHVAKKAFEDTVWYANRTYDENGFLVLGQVLLEYAGSATKIPLNMFPENVKYIADSAFYSDTLEKIAIPNYVDSIGSMAFFDCENLTAIYMQRAVCPQIVGGVIATSDVQIYVPKNSLSSYQDWLVHDNISVGVTAVYLETQGEYYGWIELACGDVLPDFIQPPNDWYKFLGWEDVNTGKLYQTYDVIDFLWEDAKLVAQWELIIHNIYYTIEGGVNHPSNPTEYSAENQDIVVYDPIVDVGKSFEGWYLDEWYNTPYTNEIFESFGGVMLFAKISNAQYNITFVSEGTQVDPQTVTYGVVNDFPVSEREDYSFQGWYTDDGKKVATAEGFGVAKWDIPNHTTLEARWLRKYFVVAEVNGQLAWLGNEDFVGEQTSIDYGTKFNCPVCCMTLSFMRSDERIIEGHVFKGFSASENGELLDCWGATVPAIEEILSRQYTEGVNAYKIYPVYEKEVYSVVIDRADGSVATETRVQFDAEVPYPTDIYEAEINPGYNFLRWKISAYGISTFEINDLFNFERMPDISYNYEGWGSITISACWEANEYTVRLIRGDGVIMNDEKAVYDSESNVFSVPNKAGYRFLGWYDSENVKYADELGRATRKWDKNYDSELFAKFEIINYTVNFVDEKFYITTNPMNYNIETGIYELPQIEQLGYIFNGWAENGTVINQISTGRTGDINLVATWIGEEFKAHETTSTLISSGNYSGTTAVIINLENLSSTTDRTYTIDSSIRQVSFFGISGVQYKINLIIDTRNQDLTLNLKDVAFSKDANIIYAQSNVPLTIKSYGQSGLFAENRKNAMLLLNSSVNIYVKDSLTIIGGSSEQELFAGSVAIKVKDLSVYLEQQALLTVKGGDGIDGVDGEEGVVGAVGASVSSPCENGYPGGDGGAGTAGIRGSSGADAIVLSGNFYIHGNGSLILQGGNGGSGGNGGTGGTGGEGTIGGAAGFLNTAGTGGNGGTGGIGGAGGTGGKGGLPFSGALEVSNNGVNLVFAIGNCGTGGNGGNGGTGGKAGGGGLNTALGNDGEGGNGGNGGTGGKGGDAYSVTFTCEELNIHLSQQGAVGSGGTGGVGGERGLGGHNKVELAGNNGQTGVSGTDGNIIS